MSGHSKWNNIKRKKEKTDAAKAKVFTKIGREISVIVKTGGANPNENSKLKDAIAKAKAANVPNENIERIIKKEERIMNNGCVPPTAPHFNQVSCSGKKHSSQSSQPILFAPLRAAHQHYSLFIIIYYF